MTCVLKKVFRKDANQCTFAIASMKPTNGQSDQKQFAFESHHFQANTSQQRVQMQASLGNSVIVGKYDIPSFNLKAPLGTSIFQLQKEREFANQNHPYLTQKYKDNIAALNSIKPKNERNPHFIEEPKPGANHVICAVCREQFRDYHEHIFSQRHKKGVQTVSHIFD